METDIHLQRILLKADRSAMHHSLEVRVPLLSNAMLDESHCYSYNECIENAQGKMVLKKILAAKTKPALVFKPKKGFTVPMDEWLRQELKHEVHETILNMPFFSSGIFSRRGVEQLLNEHSAAKNNAGWLIWALYSFAVWHSTHCNKT